MVTRQIVTLWLRKKIFLGYHIVTTENYFCHTVLPISLTLDNDPETSVDTNLHDLVDKCRKVGTFESLLQASHLIENAAKSPHVRPVIVWLAFTLTASKIHIDFMAIWQTHEAVLRKNVGPEPALNAAICPLHYTTLTLAITLTFQNKKRYTICALGNVHTNFGFH